MSSRLIYGGKNDHPGMSSVRIGVGSRGLSELRCEPDRIMPADTPIPAKDARVVVVKRQKHEVPSYLRCTKAGLYELALPDQKPDWFSKKGEAVEAGLRRIAILDYQATRNVEREHLVDDAPTVN